jgi:hypothetical protein
MEEGGFEQEIGSATASETRGFLQPADIVPNVGTKSGGREEVYIVGRGGRWLPALGKP